VPWCPFFGGGLVLLLLFIHSAIVWSAKSAIVKIWSPTPELQKLGELILSIISLTLIFDGFQFVTGCIIKAVGRQKIGSFIHLFCFYGIALPGGYVGCTVLGYGVSAYWASLTLALFFVGISFSIVIWRINWKEEVTLAARRTQYEVIIDDEEITFKLKNGK